MQDLKTPGSESDYSEEEEIYLVDLCFLLSFFFGVLLLFCGCCNPIEDPRHTPTPLKGVLALVFNDVEAEEVQQNQLSQYHSD